MLRLVKTVLGLPVVTPHNPEKLAEVESFIVDPAKGKIVAYQMRGRRKNRYLSTIDVVGYFADAVSVRDEQVLQELDEVVRIKVLLEQPVKLLGLPVVTAKGKKLGKVKDVTFETEGHFIAKLHVQPSLITRLTTEELIFSREQVIKMTPREVTVRYDEKAAAPGAQAEIAS